MNFAALLCRRLNIKELVANVPVYQSAGGITPTLLYLKLFSVFHRNLEGFAFRIEFGVQAMGYQKDCRLHKKWTRFKTQESWREEILWRGNYVGVGKDHTLFALKEGCVKFERSKLTGRKWVHVESKDGHLLHPVYANVAAS